MKCPTCGRVDSPVYNFGINQEDGHFPAVFVISGKPGRSEVTFDWFEEQTPYIAACIDCVPDVRDGWLVWDCEECGGGKAKLHLDVVTVEIPREDEIPVLHALRALQWKWSMVVGCDPRVVSPEKAYRAIDELIHSLESIE